MDILDFPGCQPFNNHLNLFRSHSKSTWRHDVAKIFNCIDTPFTFFGIGKEVMFSETFKNLLDMLPMRFQVIRVNEYIVQIDNDMDINQILENIINES